MSLASTLRPLPPTEVRRKLPTILPQLRARAASLCGNPSRAEDLVQDAVERALRFESRFIPGSNLKAWMMQVLYRVFVSGYRRRRRERSALEQFASDPNGWIASGGPPSDVGRALSPAVEASLALLPTPFRSAIELVDIQQKPYRDAAAELGVPVGTVMSRIHRGRRLLRARLAA